MDDGKTAEPSIRDPRPGDLCERCGGLMLTDHYMDLLDDTGHIDVTVRRCTNCGEVVDPVILENRVKVPPNLLYGTKQRKFGLRVNEGRQAKDEQDDPPMN